VRVWTKPDPAALGVPLPNVCIDSFPGFETSLQRYKYEVYCVAWVPKDDHDKARVVVQAFFDLYAYERRWQVLNECKREYEELQAALLEDVFTTVDADEVNRLLRSRRFVVLQGPPGTGKTRLADEVRRKHFDGRGMTVQFHPAVTYEDFVIGLSPDPQQGTLRFGVRLGWLLEAAKAARAQPYLLVVDEVNRADLGKVLGEAIYLFEPREVGGDQPRAVQLPYPADGSSQFSLPENLYVLATMNTADRSIASMDLAIRRRFSFISMMPDRRIVDAQKLPLATDVFTDLCAVFVEHAPPEALNLLPGHAYFLANTESEVRERLRHEVLPLLDEYLREGYLGNASTELHAVRDSIEDRIG
jgi:5-methylcytosine-specific restriction protein B